MDACRHEDADLRAPRHRPQQAPQRPSLQSVFEEDMRCGICLQLPVQAVLLQCNYHVFCNECISKWLASAKKKCPTCKTRQNGAPRRVPFIDRTIERSLASAAYAQHDVDEYLARTLASGEAQRERVRVEKERQNQAEEEEHKHVNDMLNAVVDEATDDDDDFEPAESDESEATSSEDDDNDEVASTVAAYRGDRARNRSQSLSRPPHRKKRRMEESESSESEEEDEDEESEEEEEEKRPRQTRAKRARTSTLR